MGDTSSKENPVGSQLACRSLFAQHGKPKLRCWTIGHERIIGVFRSGALTVGGTASVSRIEGAASLPDAGNTDSRDAELEIDPLALTHHLPVPIIRLDWNRRARET